MIPLNLLSNKIIKSQSEELQRSLIRSNMKFIRDGEYVTNQDYRFNDCLYKCTNYFKYENYPNTHIEDESIPVVFNIEKEDWVKAGIFAKYTDPGYEYCGRYQFVYRISNADENSIYQFRGFPAHSKYGEIVQVELVHTGNLVCLKFISTNNNPRSVEMSLSKIDLISAQN